MPRVRITSFSTLSIPTKPFAGAPGAIVHAGNHGAGAGLFRNNIYNYGSPFAVPVITVEVPVYGENNQKTPSLKTQIVFPINIPAADFFSRVYAKMNVDPTTAVLGWKESQDRRGDPYQSLTSSDDLANAFGRLVKIQNNTRRKKEVIMEVVNLVCSFALGYIPFTDYTAGTAL